MQVREQREPASAEKAQEARKQGTDQERRRDEWRFETPGCAIVTRGSKEDADMLGELPRETREWELGMEPKDN